MKDAAPAIIGLVGTLVALLVGYRQWRQQSRSSRRTQYREERARTLQELWDRLQTAHLQFRTGLDQGPDEKDVRIQLQELNVFIIKRSPYLETDEVGLARRYLDSVARLTRLMKNTKDPRLRDNYEITGPLFVPGDLTELLEASREFESLYNQLRLRVRAAVAGEEP